MLSLLKRTAPDTSRERLKAAFNARDQAQQAVVAKRETVERQQSAIREFDEPERAKDAAARALKEFRPKWAANGANYTDTLQLYALEQDLKEKTAAAENAAPNREALRRELARAEDALESLQEVDLRGREEGITAAVASIAVQENAQLLDELVQDAERFLATRAKVMGLRLALYRPWSLPTKNSMDPSHEALALIDEALDRAAIESWTRYVDNRQDPKAYLDALTAPWRALVAKLRGEPNS